VTAPQNRPARAFQTMWEEKGVKARSPRQTANAAHIGSVA